MPVSHTQVYLDHSLPSTSLLIQISSLSTAPYIVGPSLLSLSLLPLSLCLSLISSLFHLVLDLVLDHVLLCCVNFCP